MTEREAIERIKFLQKNCVKVQEAKIATEESNNRKKRWITFWRNNINLYIHYKLGIRSFPYQHYAYYQMQEATTYVEVSTRGVSKSFKAQAVACAYCCLYPGYKVVYGAVTRSQAQQSFMETFKGEICGKYSPYMKWLVANGYVTSRETEQGILVSFWNGSSITFCPVLDSSRGNLRLYVRFPNVASLSRN